MENNKALNPTIKKLGAISFFADVASEMLYPITPIFLTSVLGSSMIYLGLIEGIAEALASLLKTYSGNWSDRILKRKPFVIVGYLLGAVAKPLIGLSANWLHVLVARGVDRVGKGLRSAPRDALIADAVTPDKRGEAFGWHRSMDTLGAALGPLLTVTLISSSHTNLRNLYFIAFLPGLISVLIALSIKDINIAVKRDTIQDKKNQINWKWSQFGTPFRSYLLAWTVFSLVNSSDVFLIMKAKNMGFTISQVVLLYCAYNITYALSSPYLGRLSDQLSRKNLMIFGLLIYAVVYLGFGSSTQHWQIWGLFLLYGIYMGATDGVGKALAVDYCPKQLKATGLGILGTITGVSTIIASTTAGILWDKFNSSAPFYMGATGALGAIVLFFRLPKSLVKAENEG